MELLDVFAHVLQEIPLSLEQHRELFLMAALSSDIGSIPNTLDQVSIGSADRMRPNSPKATIVIGVNQGEFPPQLSENGLFSEVERDRLLESGIQLNPSGSSSLIPMKNIICILRSVHHPIIWS